MKSLRRIRLFLTLIGLVALISTVAALGGGISAQEQEDVGIAQPCSTCGGLGTTSAVTGTPSASEGLGTSLYSATLNGGYVAAGTGLRNRGWGHILIKDVPLNSTVVKAYLFWSIISPPGVTTPPASYAACKLRFAMITGTLMGSSAQPCWGGGLIFGYRADVTSTILALAPYGNFVYPVWDFATGYKWGDADPWSSTTVFPAIEGASLVIVYSNSQMPMTHIQIKAGVDTTSGTVSTTTFSGFPAATKPVAKTTFIVADGQSNASEIVQFNGINMPANFCDGLDRQDGPDWMYGNLQDTNTAWVKVNPGATSATATLQGGPDCITWLAQVFSIFEGSGDLDGDALKDYWEVYGYDYTGDGVPDIDLPGKGASPFHKDIFVYVDWMLRDPNPPSNDPASHRPDPSVVTRAVSTFANAPYAIVNPDGYGGINIHIDVAAAGVAHDYDLNPVWTDFDVYKNTHPTGWWDIYHYCLFAHGHSGGSSSGISRGIPASDFVVSLGRWGTNPGTPDQQTGTFIHELGHNLSLRHGGFNDVNYKPNYLSIMNYFFQMSGVYRNGSWGNYDYQRINAYTLDENALVEANGIGDVSAGYGTQWYDPSGTVRGTTVHKPINWNWDLDSTDICAVDINGDGSKTSLGSQNNWYYIVYNGGTVGGVGAPGKSAASEAPPCLTYEEFQKMPKPAK